MELKGLKVKYKVISLMGLNYEGSSIYIDEDFNEIFNTSFCFGAIPGDDLYKDPGNTGNRSVIKWDAFLVCVEEK